MSDLPSLWRDLTSASPGQLGVRGVLALGTAMALLSLALLGSLHPALLVVLVLLGGAAVLNPHTLVPGLLIGYVVVVWLAVAPGWHWALLLATWGLLLVHAAAALAASVPAQAELPSSLLVRWAARTGVVGLAATALYALAGLVHGLAAPAAGVVPGLVGLAAVVAGLVLVLRRWSSQGA